MLGENKSFERWFFGDTVARLASLSLPFEPPAKA